ncbi:hypothetical protein [Metabacillus idriensis]|uniref:hypothetical protein n=1 Tax=Metabacillus idriensis TaxID=324768 RepID=UPI003D28352A
MMKHFLMLILFLVFLTACTNEKPRPEGDAVPMEISIAKRDAMEAGAQTGRQLYVNHHIKGQNVYIECFVPNFTFSNEHGKKINGEGYMNLYVDGKKTDEIHTAAFIIKGLKTGTHTISLELLHNDSSKYHLKKTWNVTVQ